MRKSLFVWLVIVGVLFAACTPAAMPETAPRAGTVVPFSLSLGRIPITVDESGTLGIEGFLSLAQLDQLAALFNLPVRLSGFGLPPELVRLMMANGIQHIEMRHTGESLLVLVNGKRLPSISWGDGTLDNLAQLTPLLGPQGAQLGRLVQQLIPIVKGLGLTVALKFPVPEGATPIPFASDEVALATPVPPAAAPWLAAQFEVKYDERGVPSFLGMSAEEVQALFPDRRLMIALDRNVIAQAQANNIQYLAIRSKGDGLWVYVNGAPLPPIMWDKDSISNAVDLWGQMNPGLDPTTLGLIRLFASSLLSSMDLGVILHFPLAPGAEPIPVALP